jgi:hypothetical protein
MTPKIVNIYTTLSNDTATNKYSCSYLKHEYPFFIKINSSATTAATNAKTLNSKENNSSAPHFSLTLLVNSYCLQVPYVIDTIFI